jgi:hypothetical protein
MGSTGRFTDQQVVNSFNLFIDSEKSSILGDGSSKGDDINIHLEGSSIVANDGEMIRLTLTNFEMFNNLYHIDANNSRFQTKITTDAPPIPPPSAIERDLTRQNYATLGDIAIDFANIIGNVINGATTAGHKVLVIDIKNTVQKGFLPYDTETGQNYNFPTGAGAPFTAITNSYVKPTPLSLGATSNRLLDITFEIIAGGSGLPNAHLINQLYTQFLGTHGDCYTILGGLRQDSANATFQSLDTDLAAPNPFPLNLGMASNATRIRIKGFFPMQRMSDPYVYLRCNSSQNGGLEMAILNDSGITATSNNSDITTSNIIAKLQRDVEFITYDNGTGGEYFVNLQQRKLSSLRLTLTDSKNRPLGRNKGDTNGTAAGFINGDDAAGKDGSLGLDYINATGFANKGFSNTTQSTLGNLFFTAVLKVDIIKTGNPSRLESPALPLPLPARKAQNGVLSFQNFGMPKNGV